MVITASADGLIRLWTLPQRWSGTAEEIDRRVQQHAGIAFGESDQVVTANPFAAVDDSTNDTQRATRGFDNAASFASSFLSDDENDAIRLRNERRWEEAAAALSQWASLRPDDWQHLALGLRPLVELRRFEEADIAWTELTERLGRESAFAWLQADYDALSRLASTNDPSDDARHNRFNSRSAPIHGWYHRRLLEFAPDDATRAAWFLKAAKVHEAQFEFNDAAEAINQAVALDNDSADMHYYRAHLMERLNRWDEARQSCESYARLKPESKLARFRVVCSHLFAGDLETARRRWDEFAKHYADALTAKDDDAFVRGFMARDMITMLRLAMGGENDESLRSAITFANANFENQRLAEGVGPGFLGQTKGLAEYRLGSEESLKSAVSHLNSAVKQFQAENRLVEISMCRFFSAMAHARLGDSSAAERDYLDAIDHLSCHLASWRSSNKGTAYKWQLAEVARREAEELLDIDEADIEPLITDTSDWTALFEDNFDDGMDEHWQQTTGQWSVVDGAACGVLELPTGANNSAYDRLEREFPDLPETFEIEYETWTSDPMLAACYLRRSAEDRAPVGHRVALTSFPDRDLIQQNRPATGVSLLTCPGWEEFEYWFPQTVPDLQVQPGRHYQVRILRQPQRITVSVDGKEVLSERVRNIDTKTLRFFARGEEGTKMYVDNLRIRVPAK